MPIAHIHLLEGRSSEAKRELIKEVSKAISDSLGVESSRVRVLLQELPKEHWGEGGISKADQG